MPEGLFGLFGLFVGSDITWLMLCATWLAAAAPAVDREGMIGPWDT